MQLTTEIELRVAAKKLGYRPEILEKVYRLLRLLGVLMNVPYLKERIVLKGGTAINLFCSNDLPRLSVDLDFNYIGSVDRAVMLEDKEKINMIIQELCDREGYSVYRNPQAHAGGKMVLSYKSVLGAKGRLEVDMNYLYRSALWPCLNLSSIDSLYKVTIPVLDIHELAAGKLHALLDRDAARDLFDSHRLFSAWKLDHAKLRLAFTVYAGMRKEGWQIMSSDLINFDINDVRNKLIPVLKNDFIPGTKKNDIEGWAVKLVSECKEYFKLLLPFNKREQEFLSHMDACSEISPEILTSDEDLQQSIRQHPALLWKIKQSIVQREA